MLEVIGWKLEQNIFVSNAIGQPKPFIKFEIAGLKKINKMLLYIQLLQALANPLRIAFIDSTHHPVCLLFIVYTKWNKNLSIYYLHHPII